MGVRVGEHVIGSVKDCEENRNAPKVCNGPVQDLAAEEIIPHEKYDRITRINDIGLVRVKKIDLNRGE